MISPERFKGALIWQALSVEDQDAIGAATLELCAAWFCVGEAFDGRPEQTPEHRASEAAGQAANDALNVAVGLAKLLRELTDDEDRLKLPSCIGAVCRSCGCSQNDACPGRCAWAEPDLCTVCKANAGSGI